MNMRDITQEIRNAIDQNIPWSIDVFFDTIERLGREHVEISYWDGEENWATLAIDKRPIGYLWKKYPFLFVQSDYLTTINGAISALTYMSPIVVDDLDAKVFKLNYADLTDYLAYGVDYSKFSATDLWFNTNSI